MVFRQETGEIFLSHQLRIDGVLLSDPRSSSTSARRSYQTQTHLPLLCTHTNKHRPYPLDHHENQSHTYKHTHSPGNVKCIFKTCMYSSYVQSFELHSILITLNNHKYQFCIKMLTYHFLVLLLIFCINKCYTDIILKNKASVKGLVLSND